MKSLNFGVIQDYANLETNFKSISVISLDNDCADNNGLPHYESFRVKVKENFPWAKSIVIFARPYQPYADRFPAECGIYSAHYVQYPKGRIECQKVAAFIETSGFRAIPDSGIAEKAAAYLAGLGKYGKNSLIYVEPYGSFLTLHSIVTDAMIDYEVTPHANISDCAHCSLCVESCPTNAILKDGKIDSNLCLREHMLSREAVPEKMRSHMGRNILGCEICQVVCPMNEEILSGAIIPSDDGAELFNIKKLLSLDEIELSNRLEKIGNVIGSNYAKSHNIVSSATIIAGNMKDRSYIALLEKFIEHKSDVIREHADWAVRKLRDKREAVQ